MIRKAMISKRQLVHGALLSALLTVAHSVVAGPIPFDTFHQFSFDSPGGGVVGCDPADPAGAFCIGSSGTATDFLDPPPWTFLAPSAGATLTVIDAFLSGDVFEIFDNGGSLGLTSVPGSGDCGDDPVVCLGTPGMSFGVFALGAGAHSLTMQVAQAPNGAGSGYLQVAATQAVPEPASLALVLGALAVLWGSRRRQTANWGRLA